MNRLAEIDHLQALNRSHKADFAKNQLRLDRVPTGYRQPVVEYVRGMIQLRIERDQAALDQIYAEECP